MISQIGQSTRSSTPPLRYRRSESLIQQNSNILRGNGRDLQSVHVPTKVSSMNQLPTKYLASYASNVNYVNNPFSSTSGEYRCSAEKTEEIQSTSVERGGTQCRPSRTEGPSWSYSLSHGRDSDRLVSLDSEEAALLSEEATLKGRLNELRAERQLCDDEQLQISQGWATLFDREQRFYTEAVPDFSADIVACEQRCLALQEQLNHAQSHLKIILEQLKHYEPLLEEKENLAKEVKAMLISFNELESRRRNCLFRAGQFFDVESKRTIESQRAVRLLEDQLRKMENSHGHLSQGNTERSAAMVKKGAYRKSVNFADCPETRYERRVDSWEEDQGMSSSSVDISDIAPFHAKQSTIQESVGGDSVCIGWAEDDNNDFNISSINGCSTVISLNNFDSQGPLAKRPKTES